jgi:hypothetical protein
MTYQPRMNQYGNLAKLERAVQMDLKLTREANADPTRLEKAVIASTIQALVPEDLEGEAHNTLWRASDSTEMILMKLCPTTPASSIIHEYDAITSYGETRGFGFFGETGLPRESQPGFERRTTNVRLLGETSSTFLLAHLQDTIKVEGATNADAISRNMLMLSLLRKKARAMYFSDTSTTRLGAAGARFKGLIQQIREGTDGTVGSSPYGSHVIDMEGAQLTIDTIRAKAAKTITLFGRINCLIMDPFARADLEAGMDGAVRLGLPINAKPFMLGANIGGIHTQGGDVFFHTDNLLGPLTAQGQYIAAAEDLAPTSAPAVTGLLNASPTGANVSKFRATDGGNFFWLITEIKNDRESLGRRIPSSGSQAVAPGEEMSFSITPTDPNSDTFKIYRGPDGDADTEAYAIFEVANSGGGAAVTAYDLNHYRPNTGYAIGLNIKSSASDMVHSAPTGQRSSYALAVEESASFLTMKDHPQNTVSLVTLGPAMGVMELAHTLAQTSRPLVYSACAVQVRNALKNIVFINVGSASLAM